MGPVIYETEHSENRQVEKEAAIDALKHCITEMQALKSNRDLMYKMNELGFGSNILSQFGRLWFWNGLENVNFQLVKTKSS